MLTVGRAEPPGTEQTKKPQMRENSRKSGTGQGFFEVLSEKVTAERTNEHEKAGKVGAAGTGGVRRADLCITRMVVVDATLDCGDDRVSDTRGALGGVGRCREQISRSPII